MWGSHQHFPIGVNPFMCSVLPRRVAAKHGDRLIAGRYVKHELCRQSLIIVFAPDEYPGQHCRGTTDWVMELDAATEQDFHERGLLPCPPSKSGT